ncbi:MAG: flavin reductase family protein [candidate division Zixibacteria bacterium]|nr:flavin reductase family protein [candidate division Zixibacteria bacterium]MDH3937474.1 flavin reductase family protein [candidate division Zixibacteria bacterium]MDH4034822.1 flavin reductase family protein [candidate division Zixibacteria bacterium]
MNKEFQPIKVSEIKDNVFKLIGEDWMLVTAGSLDSFNTMTASWGGMGVLWNKNICWCVIRPQRYTYQFAEKADRFTLSFFDPQYRDALKFCGTKSGRDVDKMTATGLTPVASETGAVYYQQARLVLECRKDYIHDLDPANFLYPYIKHEYPGADYHRLYLGEVVNCLKRE